MLQAAALRAKVGSREPPATVKVANLREAPHVRSAPPTASSMHPVSLLPRGKQWSKDAPHAATSPVQPVRSFGDRKPFHDGPARLGQP